MVTKASIAAVILELPSAVVVTANDAAKVLLAPEGGTVVGRNIEEFLDDMPSGGLALMMAGRLFGYEAVRLVHRTGQAPIKTRAWIRRLDDDVPPRFVLGVYAGDGGDATPAIADRPDAATAPIVGTTDSRLVIDRISGDLSSLGYDPRDLIGQSILTLIAERSLSSMLASMAQAVESQGGVTLPLGVRAATGDTKLFEVLILPLIPTPSVAFAFIVGDGQVGQGVGMVNVARRLRRLGSPEAESEVGLARLSEREREVVHRLVSGDRVPAIATALFLSQSTVRNYLAAAFRKLGVNSQQELVDLFRADAP